MSKMKELGSERICQRNTSPPRYNDVIVLIQFSKKQVAIS